MNVTLGSAGLGMSSCDQTDGGVTMSWSNTRCAEQARRASAARHSGNRKSRGDAATSDRAYSPAEVEFMNAMQSYKQQSGRMFPTWSEVLEVLNSLGYHKPRHDGAPRPPLHVALG